MQKNRQAALGFIFVTIMIDVLGIGLIIPIMPELIKSFFGGNETVASGYYGILVSIYSLMQFGFAPILGGLSDRFGRRPILLVSLFGASLDYLLLALAPTFGWFFLGRIIAGIGGASFTTATAYIADVSPPEKRAQNFGLVGAAFGLGFIIGPILGGVISNSFGLRAPFLVAAVLTLINWLYGFFILPESLAPENRRRFSWLRANPIGTLANLARYPAAFGLIGTIICFNLAQRGLETTWVLYTNHRFGWDEAQNGLSLAAIGILSAIVQGVLIGRIISRLGERRALMVGMILSALSFTLYGLASQGWMMYLIFFIGALGAISGPATQALISRSVPANEQGELQGSLTSLMSLTGVVGPLISSYLFSTYISPEGPAYIPGIAFFTGTALILCGMGFAARTFSRTRTEIHASTSEQVSVPR